MRTKVILLFLLINHICFGQKETSQKIDSSNYYKFLEDRGSTDWLRESDAVPIIIDEVIKAGYSYAFINIGELIDNGSEGKFVITVSYDREKKFGFIYESGHGIPIRESDRRAFYRYSNKNINQVTKSLDGKVEYSTITKYPLNTFFLYESCYWYQFNSDGDLFPVSKKVAEFILRQDIRYCLKRVK
ncbi:hypothetical protein [Flavihumibacter profundi]|uniref:hypothetical protein n=1 Tax=Flavihumibacter profundi TaxID=2716883 RepID=UPI001CC3E978|nr:hypothetical protein [Flavihumibacter profundi]MBZ5857744.1 hypothetical protein [Flavihumibacter profundi]